MTSSRKLDPTIFVAIGCVTALYSGALAWALSSGESVVEYIFVAAVFALIFPLATWLSTLGDRAVEIARPAGWREASVVLGIAGCISLLLIPGPAQLAGWAVPNASPPVHELAIVAVKLLMFVVLPGLVLMLGFGRTARDFGIGNSRVGPLRSVLVFFVGAGLFTAVQLFFGEQGEAFKSGAYAAAVYAVLTPITFAWMSIEAGLVEEFFFRAVLQERLAQAMKSPIAGALIGSVIFGLAHAPGLALRGDNSWPEAILHCVLVLAPAGFAMAFLWMRTRNLILVALIHGAGDLIPHFAHVGELTGLLPTN